MEVGRALGLRHYFIPLGDDYILRHSARHTWVVEGEADATCSHFYDIMPPIGNYVDTIFDGTSGGPIMGLYSNPKILTMRNREVILNYIFKRNLSETFPQNRLEEILNSEFYKRTKDFSYKKEMSLLRKMPDLPANLLLEFFHLKTSSPRYGFSGLKNLREFVEVRSPFYDYNLFDFALSMPFKYRFLRRFYSRALAELVPKCADIKSTNFYLPPSTGELALYIAYLKNKLMFYYDKLSPSRRKRHSKLTFNYNHALRKPCREFAVKLLLSDRALDRGIFRRDFIYESVNDHLTGRQNLTRRLGYMISIELFFRLFIDQRPQAREFDIYGNYL